MSRFERPCFIDGRRDSRKCGHVKCVNMWKMIDAFRTARQKTKRTLP